MTIKLLASQIPQFWEAIKFAAIKADEVDEKHQQTYLNELLHALLSDKAQCFVQMDDSRMLAGLMITRITVDKITGEKSILLQALYVWQKIDSRVWTEAFGIIKEFASKEGCVYLTFTSRNPAIWERTTALGFVEKTRVFTMNVG